MLRREPPAGLEAPSTGGAGLGITATLWKENTEHVKIGGKRKKCRLNLFFFAFSYSALCVSLFRPILPIRLYQKQYLLLCPDDYFQDLLFSLCIYQIIARHSRKISNLKNPNKKYFRISRYLDIRIPRSLNYSDRQNSRYF